MFWRMAGFSSPSSVDAILDKEVYTLEELIDEDEFIQECKALNFRLVNFLQEREQVKKLVHYIIDESPEDDENKHSFRLSFIACEVFTCEIDSILRTLVEDDELMSLLFSFLKPDRPHSMLLSGYFSKVVLCLILRKSNAVMNYVQGHPETITQLVDLIGITSIMEVLIRVISAEECASPLYSDTLKLLENLNVLQMIADKFNSSDSAEVHANAAEILCGVARYAHPALSSKVCSGSFIEKLFSHAFEGTKPTSVLLHTLTICISLLESKRLGSSSYQVSRGNFMQGELLVGCPDAIDAMVENLGNLISVLDVSSSNSVMATTYGCLSPPLGKHRLKIVEFFSVFLTVGSEAVERAVVDQGALQLIINLFFEYPFNNFLHHHVENIVVTCLESKSTKLVVHILVDCKLLDKILCAEKQVALSIDPSDHTVPSPGRSPPKLGNLGHITRISNKIIQLASHNNIIQMQLEGNIEWTNWYLNVLLKRNETEDVNHWACGRPTSLHDRGWGDDKDESDMSYVVNDLAKNFSQAFQCGLFNDKINDEGQKSLEQDNGDVYFDDESAEVISSLHLGEEHESSLFQSLNWLPFEDANKSNHMTPLFQAPVEYLHNISENDVHLVESNVTEDADTNIIARENGIKIFGNGTIEGVSDNGTQLIPDDEEQPVWVEWGEAYDANEGKNYQHADCPSVELVLEKDYPHLCDTDGYISRCLPDSCSEETVTDEKETREDDSDAIHEHSRYSCSGTDYTVVSHRDAIVEPVLKAMPMDGDQEWKVIPLSSQ